MSEQRTDEQKMTPEFKATWLEALRSGRYEQGKYFLRGSESETYCCMGVACDLLDSTRWKDSGRDDAGGRDWGELSAVYAGSDLARVLGLDPDDVSCLAAMNDSDKNQKSFAEIADWIEANL